VLSVVIVLAPKRYHDGDRQSSSPPSSLGRIAVINLRVNVLDWIGGAVLVPFGEVHNLERMMATETCGKFCDSLINIAIT
jgi:hypothetical protein